MEDLKTIISNFSKEHNKEEGFVSCEFSLHKDKIEEFKALAKQEELIFGKWILMECETCEGYHGKGFMHASIEKFDYISKMKSADNFVLCVE